MNPQRIVIKDFNGNALVRWMVGSNDRVAYVTDEDGAADVIAGSVPRYVVGFPLSDIYHWDERVRIRPGKCRNWAIFTRLF